MTNQSSGHVILLTNESGGEQLPPGANGNCRLLVDDSSSTDGQLVCGREREVFKGDFVTKQPKRSKRGSLQSVLQED